MARKKSKAKKKNADKTRPEDAAVVQAPHTFVFCRGLVGTMTKQLTLDMRRVMEPYTASNLKIRKRNVLRDFVSVAGPLGVTHFISFNKTQENLTMRIMRLPKGPTLYFRVHNYCGVKDVVSVLKRPKSSEGQYRHPPLLVLNDFKKESKATFMPEINNPHKLCATMLQNMFPSITLHSLNLNKVRRCVLFNYVAETDRIEFRHYNITVKPVGMSRRMKKIVTQKTIPNMSNYTDVSDYLMNRGDASASESEAELDNDPNNQVDLPQRMIGHGNMKNHQSAIRLTELGPRLTLELYKIEEGLCKGEVLFHNHVEKTEEEKEALRQVLRKKTKLKLKRKAIQELNVKRKKLAREENKERSLAGMKQKHNLDDASHEQIS